MNSQLCTETVLLSIKYMDTEHVCIMHDAGPDINNIQHQGATARGLPPDYSKSILNGTLTQN